jgi:gamma-glutamyltranspeptidase / glutathione hydrolase
MSASVPSISAAGDAAALGPHGIQSEAHRPVVMGRRGMVCSAHPLASLAGISVLQRGGDAADAALAVAAALGVAEPGMSGPGGDGFIMYFRAGGPGGRRVEVLNATGPAPAAATLEFYREGIPFKGIGSVSVPGLVDGWLEGHARYGKLPLAAVLKPAIQLAEGGLPVSHRLASSLAGERKFGEYAPSRPIYWPEGRPPLPGEVIANRDLARTYRGLAEHGRDYFYAGPVARAADELSRRHGGALFYDDLARYRARWQEPIATTYRGRLVYETPPNSSGHVLLQELNLLEGFDVAALGWHSPELVHLMAEAKKLAFVDREAYLADPDFTDVPVAALLSKEYAHERRRLIDPQRASAPGALRPGLEGGVVAPARGRGRERREDTTCFVVADGEGNVVCQLQSLQQEFGSALVAGNTGVLLNNRMTYWHLDPAHPDCLAPASSKTITQFIVWRTRLPGAAAGGRPGEFLATLGTPGADTQVQTNLQLLSGLFDFGLTPVEAVEAPRWRHVQDGTESTLPHTLPDALMLEARFGDAAREGLAALGHPVQVIGPWAATGSAMVIRRDPSTGVYWGAADPRRDGYALGW